jgi:hypothetical protein
MSTLEQNVGRYTYISLDQVKNYLVMNSNTSDARLANIINYATSVIEHYIGQEILANNYSETFDGGKNAMYVSRLPLNNVYQVSEYNGVDFSILADCSTNGNPVSTSQNTLIFYASNARLNSKHKKFGKSCLDIPNSGFIYSNIVPAELHFEDSDFTIEMYVKIDESVLTDNVIFSINSSADSYMRFSFANQYGLAFEANVSGVANTILGANSSVEAQQYNKKKWAHIAVSRDAENEKLYLHYNGNTIANANYYVSNNTFTSNVLIGETFKGYIDEVRVSTKARYKENFIPTAYRFRPDSDTVVLLHFDNDLIDSHATKEEYIFSRDTGKISKQVETSKSMGIFGNPVFQDYNNGIMVEYNAGYEQSKVPYDLQLATLDFIKLLYKQDQDKKGFNFEGERSDSFVLSSNFPPHIRRILDLYRII